MPISSGQLEDRLGAGMTANTSTIGTGLISVGPRQDTGHKGGLFVTPAAVAFSTAGLLTRLIVDDVWTMLFWRGLFGVLVIACYLVCQQLPATPRDFTAVRWPALLSASC